MNIYAGGIYINIDLCFKREFKKLDLFKTDIKPEFLIQTKSDDFNVTVLDKISETKYYKKYQTDNGVLQIQYYLDKEVGKILYKEKEVYLFLTINSFYAEYMLAQYAFAYLINNFTSNMFIHSSSVKLNNNGLLLLAKSGVGKSTLRKELEDVGGICINDDKNILSFEEDGIYILECPFAGKHFVLNPLKTKLNALIFVKRGQDNKIYELDKKNAILEILGQIMLPSKKNKEVWDNNLNKLLNLRLIDYHCNISSDTAKILKDYLEK